MLATFQWRFIGFTSFAESLRLAATQRCASVQACCKRSASLDDRALGTQRLEDSQEVQLVFQHRTARTAAMEVAFAGPAAPVEAVIPGHHLIVRVLPSGSAARRARSVVRQVLRDAGVSEDGVTDAEIAIGELAANADTHAWGPYEVRIITVGGRPIWCEVVDADEDLGAITTAFDKLSHSAESSVSDETAAELPPESGHGLSIVHRLSGGRCLAFPTVSFTTGRPAKAVAFALPMSGSSE